MEYDATLDAIKLDPAETERETRFRTRCHITLP